MTDTRWCTCTDTVRCPTHAQTLTAEGRLRRISFLWDRQINRGIPFLADPALVPAMRELLDGYHHIESDDTAEDEDDDRSRMCALPGCDAPAESWGVCGPHLHKEYR